MNKQLKIVAISGIVALIAGITASTTLEQAEASQHETSYATLIDIEEDTPIGSITQDDSNAPTVQLMGIDRYQASSAKTGDITYRITFRVTAGDTNLRNIEFEIKSDISSWEFEISSLNALTSSVNVVRVKAIDADSLTGEIIGYSLTGPTSSVPGAPR